MGNNYLITGVQRSLHTMQFDYHSVINRYYLPDMSVREILLRHSRSVADLALDIASRRRLPVNPDEVECAAMLHDIGIYLTDAPGIGCTGTRPYICHGVLGADLLRNNHVPEFIARVAERHTGAGIMPADIIRLDLPLPVDRILYPVTVLERLVCYADKFYSKSGDMQKKSLERVRQGMLRHGEDILARFEHLHSEFS